MHAIRLAPMAQADFDAFVAQATREYARDKVRAGQWRECTAEAMARQTLADLLPAGLGTADHCLYVLRDAVTDRRVGTAWLQIARNAEPPFAYLNDIRIDDDAQRHGFGRAALSALEAEARNAGCCSMQLHVFGHNESARRLYAGAGYRVTNVNMRKDFS
jgi:ribosomal protein S18 acetylase RimI-like enzyme